MAKQTTGMKRRDMVLWYLGAALGLPLASLGTTHKGRVQKEPEAMGSSNRMPVIYLPHGGGPWPFVELNIGTPREKAELSEYLVNLPSGLGAVPKALLVISAHWEESVPTLMNSPQPPMLYDYYGFPSESYRIQWPAPGAPALAEQASQLLSAAGFEPAHNGERGFDHGTFVPLKVSYPSPVLPTLQLSMLKSLDPAEHLAIGRALAPLRDEGVLIIGSGMSFHDLRALMTGSGGAVSEEFDAWLQAAATAPTEARDKSLEHWATAPAARRAHPREDHLLPLMVVAGAAGADPGRVAFSGRFANARISAFHYG